MFQGLKLRAWTASVLFPVAALMSLPTDVAAEINERTLRISLANNREHPQNIGAAKFAEIVERESGGKIKVRLYEGGVLGPDLQGISAMQGGTLDMMVGTTGMLAGNVKEFTVLDLPFLFQSNEEVDAIVDGPIGERLFAKLPDRNMVGLAFYEFGMRHFHTRSKAVREAEDFKGLKLRVQPLAYYIDMIQSFGANPVPMPYTETYSAMEQGAVDGMSNSLINIVDGKYDEVSRYVTLTGHVYQASWLGMSKRTWDRLTPEEQALIKDAAQQSRLVQREAARRLDKEALERLRASNLEVIELSAPERAKLQHQARPVVEKHAKLAGEAFYQEVQDALAQYRAAQQSEKQQ